ncbi:HlyC/CorC family transporter [Lachnospiraceae bacterium MD1]|uniref:HlyC/CorC family transporter n=1 Tax=Variimorphobacter saccharofermentans TaxID=2755051 RepID=A0A839JZH5_9FIRM|nr:hemolysin family protein [Variimorphobacter saccharofermentans]MBB2182607.1 HlyC/CorC family transporter [Variimorphobacter saccharofermentans]
MDNDNPISGIVSIILLIIVNAVVSGAKASLLHINENSVRKKAEAGHKRAGKLIKMLDKSANYLNVFDLLLSFTNISIGMIYFSRVLSGTETTLMKSNFFNAYSYLKPVYIIVTSIILVLITVLFGIVLPKKIAIKHAENTIYPMIGLIQLIGFVVYPFSWILEKTMNLLLRIVGIKPSELADSVTEEEILSIVNEGHEQGVFDAGEAEMISNIIELDDKEARDIMTYKKKIVAVNSEMSVEEALKFMLAEKYSRYPLYEGNRDNIIGILHMKDVISAYISEELRSKSLREIAREPYFVPDTQNINILFHDMQTKNIHMAIVIDEYGQTAGLVALEDFLEEIVGNINDEYDIDENMVIAADEHSITVNGSIRLEELSKDLEIELNNEDFDTLNGLLISLLDRIPGDGEQISLDYQEYHFDILETSNNMIQKVKISKLPEETTTEDGQEAEEPA